MSESDEENSSSLQATAASSAAAKFNKEDKTLEQFLELLQDDSAIATLLFTKRNSGSDRVHGDSSSPSSKHRSMLLHTCQELFRRVEELSRTLQQVTNDQDTKHATPATSLSGLDELYLGTGDNDDEEPVDIETVWGQVDLQNEALHTILKKSVKRLTKVAQLNGTNSNDKIQLLDLEGEIFNGDKESNHDTDEELEDNDDDENENSEEDDDEVTRRMRARMERALDDQPEIDDDDHNTDTDDAEDFEDTRFFGKKTKKNESKGTKTNQSNDSPKKRDDDDGLIDAAAEELNNGFFDINEMEAFADEEEDMLPEDVWEPTPSEEKKKSVINKKSFHQRQREGIENQSDGDDSDGESDDDEVLFNQSKRKKYREDDEIEALYSLYTAPAADDDDDDNDAVNMTAADLFGPPNKKYFHKWKAQQETEKRHTKPPMTAKRGNPNKENATEDDDSWNAFDVANDTSDTGAANQIDKQKGKAKKRDDNSNSDSSSDEDDVNDDGDSDGSDTAQITKTEGHKASKKREDPKATKKPVKPKTRFMQQQEKLKEETERLQQELIQEKPWQMMGEASSAARPVNSLLEGTPEFQVASKIAPLITEEHTANLEDIIKQRILAEDWDDIIPRELPDVAWHKKRGELPEVSQEKAKLGLGELYEREFLKKAAGYDVDAAEKETEEEKAKNEMKQLFANICSKLDALSNYHFAPRPVADEAEVRPATTPAIAMEEVLPLHVSDARGAAPEEVYGKKRGREGILRSDAELEQVERKRIRSSKKAARRKARQQKDADNKLIARVNPGLGLNNPYEKRKAKEEVSMARAEGRITQGQATDDAKYGSSNKFFKKLQDDVSKTLRDNQETSTEKKKALSSSHNSSRFKL